MFNAKTPSNKNDAICLVMKNSILFRNFILWLWRHYLVSLKECNEFKNILTRQLCNLKYFNECVPLLVSASRLTIGLLQMYSLEWYKGMASACHHVLWPGDISIPPHVLTSTLRTWSWTANPDSPPRHVPLQQPLRRPGLRLRRLWRPGLWPWLLDKRFSRPGLRLNLGGYGCGSGLGSFGFWLLSPDPLFFRRCGFSSFY